MSSSQWEPLQRQLDSLRDAVSRMMDQTFSTAGRADSGQSIPVNMFESGDSLVVMAPLPGTREEDVELTAQGNTLTISTRDRGELKTEEAGKRYLRREWRGGPYLRTVELPYSVDPNSADAMLTAGILTVRLTKSPTERTHKIHVRTTTA